MKNSKMLFVLAASIMSVAVSADNNPHVLPIGEYCSLEILTNDTSNNGNVVHHIIKNYGNKDFKFSIRIDTYPFALEEDIKAGIQQVPYNQLPELLARQLYLQHKYANLDEDIAETAQDNLKALLAGKDDEGKTPVDIAREKAIDNPIFVEVAKGFEYLEQELKKKDRKTKQFKLEQKARQQKKQEATMAMMILTFLNNR